LRKLDDVASVNPTLIYLAVLAIISLTMLIAGTILEPFFNIMRPGTMRTFLTSMFSYGIAIAMFFIASFSYLMHMQKAKYKGGPLE
jgi:uncharacterized membrane protein